jgi:phosphoserine phosphatase
MAHSPRITLTLYFVRHGRTEMNRLRMLQGRGGYGLLPEGVADAERAAVELAGKQVNLIYSSDQRRALETARVIHGRLRLRSPLRRSPSLREMDYGEMSGRHDDEVRRLCPLWRKDARFVFPGGESFALVQERAFRWLDRLLRRHGTGKLAVVTHGGWLRSLFAGLKGVPLSRCLNGTVDHGLVGRLDVSADRGFHLTVTPGVTIFPPS